MPGEVFDEEITRMLTLGMAATERGDYASGLQLLGHVYQNIHPSKAPAALSSYGLCLAKAGGKNRAGAELCDQAIKLQFYEGRHWANLVRVYIAANNRRKAVQVLEKGLNKMRQDVELLRVRDEIGYRKAPWIHFLPRTNPLNKFFSRYAERIQKRGGKIVLAAAAIIYIAMLVGVFFLILD